MYTSEKGELTKTWRYGELLDTERLFSDNQFWPQQIL